MNRQDILRLVRIVFELQAQVENMIVYGTGAWVRLISPHFVQYLFTGNDLVPMFDQDLKQGKFCGGQVNLLPVLEGSECGKIQFDIAKLVLIE